MGTAGESQTGTKLRLQAEAEAKVRADEREQMRERDERNAKNKTMLALHEKARKQARDLMGTLQHMSEVSNGFASGGNWHQGGQEVHLAYSVNVSLDGVRREEADGTILEVGDHKIIEKKATY